MDTEHKRTWLGGKVNLNATTFYFVLVLHGKCNWRSRLISHGERKK